MKAKAIFIVCLVICMVGWRGMISAETLTPQFTITVNQTGDLGDPIIDGVCDVLPGISGNQCSLRAAIQEANAYSSDNTIEFSSGLTITLSSPLPDITDTVFIDGISASGSSCPSGATPANLLVTVTGDPTSTDVNFHGITFGQGSSASSIRGLRLINFPGAAIRVLDSGNVAFTKAVEIKIVCNEIGFDGTTPAPNRYGIHISSSTENGRHQIGGSNKSQRNVISGNTLRAIYLSAHTETTILNNYIGTAADGVTALPNLMAIETTGGSVLDSSGYNIIGAPGQGNIIAHNDLAGVWLRNDDNSVRFNKMFDNNGSNIDADTTTPGDEIPTLYSGNEAGNINGNLPSSYPSGDYIIDVYQSYDCTPNGSGQGRNHIGSFTTTVTSGVGGGAFNEVIATPPLAGRYIAITSTGPTTSYHDGSTSSLSTCYLLPAPTHVSASSNAATAGNQMWIPLIGAMLLVLTVITLMFYRESGTVNA